MVVFSKPDKVAGLLTAFFTKVDLGKAKTRMDANPARIAEAAAPALPRHLSFVALAITLTAIALATFASEDLTCLTAGLLAARGVIPLFDAMVACFVGIWIGDMLLYFIGRYGGRWAVARRPLRWLITPAAVDSAAGFLHKRGGTAVFSSRFMPGTRLPLYVAAGIVRVPLAKMAIWFGISGMLWAIPVVALVSLFGEKVTDWIMGMGKFVFPALILLLVIFHFAIRIVTVLATHQGRRILLAKWQRLIRWEFWPPYVLYIPVVLTLIPRILRRGNPLALTACNPGIAHSGIMGESKSAILTALDPSGNVPPFLLIPADVPEKSRIAQQWISSKGITFPLVIKPDSGERGNGVSIVKSHPELDAELAQREEPQILQAYVPGDEFGILYICPPDGETPYISSVTRKVMTQVTGDGIRTLEELILNDSRAYLSHRHFFQTHSAILGEIPANGEKITLATLGSHCRGSLFLDGSDLITPELTAEVQRISETFPGFRIGRYDIRCPSEAELMAGKNLRIIELNGMTSEPTHIYHPHTPLRTGLRALISHWDTAHRIGLENLRNSARASSFQELFLLLKNRR